MGWRADNSSGRGVTGRVALAATFSRLAARYWLGVFPRVCRERRRWRARAQAIPDPELRRIALESQRKWGNVEGAAAFAALVPRGRHRAAAARAMVCFQAAYNYLDLLGEQPNSDPATAGRRLHRALPVALDPGAPHEDYYAGLTRSRDGGRAGAGGRPGEGHRPDDGGRSGHGHPPDDGGYLTGLVDSCRAALTQLPAYPELASAARAAAERIVEFQSCNTGEIQGDYRALERWARAVTPDGSDLYWWETAAAGGSSLAIYALIALAAAAGQPSSSPAVGADTPDSRPQLVPTSDRAPVLPYEPSPPLESFPSPATVQALQDAYFPWIGALHSLLDNLIDTAEDRATGQHSLIERYDSPEQAAERLGMLARRSLGAVCSLPCDARDACDARAHAVVLVAMASFYLSTPQARAPAVEPVARAVMNALDGPARPAMLVFAARRLGGRA